MKLQLHENNNDCLSKWDIISIPKMHFGGVINDRKYIIIKIDGINFTAIPYIKLPFKWMHYIHWGIIIVRQFITRIYKRVKHFILYPYYEYKSRKAMFILKELFEWAKRKYIEENFK